jgi:hypothetical protein
MSTKCRLACLVFALGGLLVVLPTATQAGKAKPETQEEKDKKARETYTADLVMAYRLMELGETELAKEKKADKASAAVSLLAAAATFRRIAGITLEGSTAEKPTIENSKGQKITDAPDQVEEAPNLTLLSDGLLKKLRELSKKDNLNIEKAIEGIEKGARHACGGPKQISRAIGGNQSHSYHIDVEPLKPVAFAFHGSFPMRVTVVRHDNDNVYGGGTVANANTTFHAGPSKTGKVTLTIRVHNESKQHGSYQMFVN